MLETVCKRVDIKTLSLDYPDLSNNLEKRFKVLKKEFFDSNLGYWHWFIPKVSFNEFSVSTNVQLIGVIVENLFDQESAKKSYNHIKSNGLYDNKSGFWYLSSKTNQTATAGKTYVSIDQLLGVYSDSVVLGINPEKKLSFLRNSLLSVNLARWNRGVVGDSRVLEGFTTSDHLSDVLTTNLYDCYEAKMRFDYLKATNLFNEKKGLWNTQINKGDTIDTTLITSNQLLSVICEAQFNKLSAKEQFLNLKKSGLYDPLEKKWATGMDPETGLKEYSGHNVADKLLEIWVEHALDSTLNEDKFTHLPDIPERRNF